MSKIVWDDEELDKNIMNILVEASATIENPLAPYTILRLLKESHKNLVLGINRVNSRLMELFSAGKIGRTSSKHPRYYIKEKFINKKMIVGGEHGK